MDSNSSCHADSFSTTRYVAWVPSKLILDYVLAISLLALLCSLFIAIAIVIKLDSKGPVYFRQPRVGINNQIFRIWKFRTMYLDRTDDNGKELTRRNDPRVTRVGHWLRRTSLDELPQLFNVLARQMSLVGPRPHAVHAKVGSLLYAQSVTNYDGRHCVLPGITGWAQINGWRGETSTLHQIEQRVRYDLEYIERRSLWFDIRIIFLDSAKVGWKKCLLA